MIYVGTSGFSYDDWKGNWYPPDLAKSRMFDFYASRFNAVEVNSTFYTIPGPRMMESLIRRGRGRLKFSIKLTQEITHKNNFSQSVVDSFRGAIAPARESGDLGALLIQFPSRFHFTAENAEYLDRVITAFEDFLPVVEYRHTSWQSDDGMNYFRRRGISTVVVDMPRLSSLPETRTELTGPIAYVRFHGRNYKTWFNAESPGDPYNYLYSEDELQSWVEPVKEMERRLQTAFVFFNNHVRGQAPRNATMFLSLLGEKPTEPAFRDLFENMHLE